MNRRLISVAEAANRSWVTSTPRRSLIDRRASEAANDSGVRLPHTVLAACWPRANARWPGVLGWPTLRWPWNGLRRILAVLWPCRWSGTRHRWLNTIGRLAWTIFGSGLLLVAVTASAILTATAAVLYVVANAVGFVAVAAGWSPPMAFETIPPTELDIDRALFTEDDEHHRNHLASGHAGRSASGGELRDNSDRPDPHLAAQELATRELARHNDLLEQHQQRPPRSAASGLPAYDYGGGARRPLAARVAIWLFVASSIIGCLFFLTAVGLALWSANGGPQPPTSGELITSIHDRTEARNQQRADEFEEVLTNEGGTP